jgi:predicted metal-dependent hydrolase
MLPQYIHIIKPKLKHIYLSFDTRGNLVIKSPKISQKRIEQLLLKKASWITESRQKLLEKKGKSVDFSGSCTLYFLGQSYPLHLISYDKKYTKLHFDGDCFSLYYSHYDVSIFQKHIDRFYKKEAQATIPTLVQTWSKTMALTPRKIRFRKASRQWGSCNSYNDLSFNTMMMKLPLDMIQYIIVHELAHISHKHHQKSFWALVQHYLPEYKTQVHALKQFST